MRFWGIGTTRQFGLGIGLLFALAVGGEASASPATPSGHGDPLDIQGLELANGQVMDRVPAFAWGEVGRVRHPVLDTMRNEVGHVWVHWDPARQHAAGIITTGLFAPGTIASPSRARDTALAWLARYIDVLAPGSSIDDFEIVSNDLSSGIRSVGLRQRAGGLRVRGGQMSVRFKADRLVYVASQALPHVDVAPHSGEPLDPMVAIASAQSWIGGDYPGATLSVDGFEGSSWLPIWTGSGFTYHEVVQVTVTARSPLGRWAVYLDAATGAPVAREQLMHSAATVRFNVPERHPGSTRYDEVAPELQVFENGMGSVTDLMGEVTLNNSPTTLNTTVTGPRVNVINASGGEAQSSFPISDGGTVVWNQAGNEQLDAQLSGFVHTSLVKSYVRNLDPGLGWLDDTIQVEVNIGGECNAASDGNDIYFLSSGGSCQNTARLADVIHHEVGHSVHANSIIEGVGAFEGALSEGISDYLAATMADDSGMGRGFFYNDQPLRELDPDGSEWTWPQDKGEVHYEGQIIGGTLWDLREALMNTLGPDMGRHHTDMIYYEGHRRAVDIPSMYPEALVYDDDDGNLSNGTPNICEINTVFEEHGLRDPSLVGGFSVDFSQQFDGGTIVVQSLLPMVAGCPVELSDVVLTWRERGDGTGGEQVDMSLEDGVYLATIPTLPTGTVIEYQVDMTFSDGETQRFPRNSADPWYQAFFGAADPIYCLDGNTDPADWSFMGPGWGSSLGSEGGVDPTQPWDDDGVLLAQSGLYEPNTNYLATGPAVDITGYEDVRLHYRRWLTVEDGTYDRATIYVNGQPEWENLSTMQADVHHLDREWRFHDLPLNDYLGEGSATIAFGLQSDPGLHFGGWTVDGMCVVEVVEQICGDGQVTGTEECDDGNTEDGDGCDAQCVVEEMEPDPTGGEDETGEGSGGGGVDETAGDGNGDGDGDSTGGGDAGQDGGASDEGCGCTAGSSGSPWSGAWLLLVVAGAVRRRRPD